MTIYNIQGARRKLGALMHFLNRRHVFRYLFGGSCVFAFTIALFYLLADIFQLWYLWATTVTFAISLVVSFSVQKYWTFRDRSSDVLPMQIGAFGTLAIFNFAMNDSFMYLAVDGLGIQHLHAQILTSICIASWSFLAYRYLFVVSVNNRVT